MPIPPLSLILMWFRPFVEKHLVQQSNDPAYSSVMSLAIHPDVVPDCYVREDVLGHQLYLTWKKEELADKQRSDPVIREVLIYLESGEIPPPVVRKEIPDFPFYLREWDRLEVKEGVLYRRRQDGDSITHQLVLPEELRSFAINQLHDQMGHMGIERTLDLVWAWFYWPRMGYEIEHRIKTCNRCVRRKPFPRELHHWWIFEHHDRLNSVWTSFPLSPIKATLGISLWLPTFLLNMLLLYQHPIKKPGVLQKAYGISLSCIMVSQNVYTVIKNKTLSRIRSKSFVQ